MAQVTNEGFIVIDDQVAMPEETIVVAHFGRKFKEVCHSGARFDGDICIFNFTGERFFVIEIHKFMKRISSSKDL